MNAVISEEEKLSVCEREIEQALDSAFHALRQIHEDSLYKAAGYKSFKAYVEERWGYSKSHAYRMIEHANLVDWCKEEGIEVLPTSEGQTRAILSMKRTAKNPEEFRQKAVNAWEMAVDTAPVVDDAPRVTGDHVESVMSHFGVRRAVKKPENVDVEEVRRRLNALAESRMLKLTGEQFVSKYGARALGNRYKEVLAWLIDADQAAMDE